MHRYHYTAFALFTLAAIGLLLLPTLAPRGRHEQYAWGPTPPGTRHIKATETVTDDQSGDVTTKYIEFWYDPDTQRARYEESNANGNTAEIEVRNGLTYSTYWPQDDESYVMTAADSSAPFLDEVKGELLKYQSKIQAEPRSVIGTQTYNDETVYVTRTGMNDEASSSQSLNGYTTEAYVSQDSGLPLKETLYQQSDIGGQTELGTIQYSYSLKAYIDPSQVPASVFTTDIPNTGYSERQTYLSPASASSFSPFTPYWLGSSYGSIPIFGIDYDQETDGTEQDNTLAVTYAFPYEDGVQKSQQQITLTESLPLSSEAMASDNSEPDTEIGEPVVVNGHQATLYDHQTDDVTLELTIGGTYITISGYSRDQVLDAASKLHELS